MKRLTALLFAAFMLIFQVSPGFASFSKPATSEETTIVSAPPKNGLSGLSAQQILSLTPETYQELTGKKMTFKEKIGLGYVKRNIKRDLKKNGSVDLADYVDGDGSMRFNIGGFVLGLLLGLIGVALAHIFSNDKSFRRSSWYGVGALLIIAIIIALAGGGS